MSQAPLGHLKKQKAIKKTLDKPENIYYTIIKEKERKKENERIL